MKIHNRVYRATALSVSIPLIRARVLRSHCITAQCTQYTPSVYVCIKRYRAPNTFYIPHLAFIRLCMKQTSNGASGRTNIENSWVESTLNRRRMRTNKKTASSSDAWTNSKEHECFVWHNQSFAAKQQQIRAHATENSSSFLLDTIAIIMQLMKKKVVSHSGNRLWCPTPCRMCVCDCW